MNWSSLPSSMSSHNKIHKPRPAGSERATGFFVRNMAPLLQLWLTVSLRACVVASASVCVCVCESLLSDWLIGMVGRKKKNKNAPGHFRADLEPKYISTHTHTHTLVYKVWTHKKGKKTFGFSGVCLSCLESGCQENKWLGDAPSSFPTMHSPIVSTSFIFFPSWLSFSSTNTNSKPSHRPV